ncbi:OLC1v1019429C2 [Oldenlandia corymbosa var. corymbosa]|nr:OLC1v1019429C2 [Oldenlandia corymbosa var. corymbosa]
MSGTSDEESLKIFPDELIIEILTWLPAKTLVKFRCVSKSWRALISTPKFIKAHLRNSSKRDDYAHHRVLFRCGTEFGKTWVPNYETRYFPLAPALFGDVNTPIESTPVGDPVMNSSDVVIAGASNGIVCVSVKTDLFFWNPTIRKFKKLPQFLSPANQRGKKYHVLFEYNEVDDDYQVCLIDFGEKCVALYSGNTNSWRKIQGFPGEFGHRYFFVRGKLYWGKGTARRIEIGYFDLKTETDGMLQQPDYGKGTFDLRVRAFQGCLAVFCYHRTSHIDMWIWKEQGLRQFWTKVLLVPKLKDPSRKKFCVPIFMSKDGKILFKYWKIMALSDPMKKSVTYPRVKSMGELWIVEVFVESLLLINDHDSKGPWKDTDLSAIDMIRHLAPHLV